jgi:hypothetical protein
MAFLEKTLSPLDNIDERPTLGLVIATLDANEDSESLRCKFEAYGLSTRRIPAQSSEYMKLRAEVAKLCSAAAGFPTPSELDALDAKAGISQAAPIPAKKKIK